MSTILGKEQIKGFFLKRGFRVGVLRPTNILVALLTRIARSLNLELTPCVPDYPLRPSILGYKVAILKDADFRRSVTMAEPHTLLDVARMANLWNLARLSGRGKILEVGTYRGGGALHLSNACPESALYIFDTFAGFRTLTPGLDDNFSEGEFKDTSEKYVAKLFEGLGREVHITKGYFPDSAGDLDLKDIAFCHLDVDVYDAILNGLNFLADRMTPSGLIVLDDYRRSCVGVDRAVDEFLAAHPEFACFPVFPGQGIVFRRDRAC